MKIENLNSAKLLWPLAVREFTDLYGAYMPKHKKLTYFISGSMTGVPNFNRDAFNSVALKLRNLGHIVVNPAEYKGKEKPWADYLKKSLRHMLKCDIVFMLPNWEKSKGANLEHSVAVSLDMAIVYGEKMK